MCVGLLKAPVNPEAAVKGEMKWLDPDHHHLQSSRQGGNEYATDAGDRLR